MSTDGDGSNLERTGIVERAVDGSTGGVFAACALVSVVTTLAIAWLLLERTLAFVDAYDVVSFLTGTEWSPGPQGGGELFGFVPLLIATLTVMIVAAFIALPVGLLTATYLSEYASPRARAILKPLLELLAGVPTVVYGIFALVYLTPALQATIFPNLPAFNLLSASIMVGIMTIPMVSSISEDAMNAVPDNLRQAGYGLGATKFQVSTRIVIPAALSGIVSSYILALSRAIGETMIVTVAAGAQSRMPEVHTVGGVVPYIQPSDVLLDGGLPITAAMVNTIGGDLVGGSIAYDAVFALGFALFVITLTMNVISDAIAKRYREVY